MTRRARILLVDGDLASMVEVCAGLTAANHLVRECGEGESVHQQVEAFRPDLVITCLSSGDGATIEAVVRRTRASYQPMLLCLLDDGGSQRASALEAGADACMDMPCTSDEIELQVRALLRRTPWLERTVYDVGRLVIDLSAHTALFDDEPVSLTGKEFDILAMLAQHAGAVLSKRALLERLWSYDAFDENLVEVHMSSLRRRLPLDARPMIRTVRGVGYVLRDDIPQVMPA